MNRLHLNKLLLSLMFCTACLLTACSQDRVQWDAPVCLSAIAPAETTIAISSGRGATGEEALAFDGTLWVAHIQADSRYQQTTLYLTRIACDGTTLVPPVQVNTTPNARVSDPKIAVAGGLVFVTWIGFMDAVPGQPMQIHYRLFRSDGTPVTSEDQPFRASVDGPLDRDSRMPDVSTHLDGFVLSGERWPPEKTGSAFLQFFDGSGNVTGTLLDLHSSLRQVYPYVSTIPDGSVYLA